MIKKLLQVFMITSLLSCNTSEKTNQYMVENSTDSKNFTYEEIKNDPTGLRLYTLDNGLKVYLSKNTDEPKIQTYIAVRAGSNYDPKESTGLAHYLEHMVFKGTDKIGTADWEKEKIFLEKISDLYEKHRAEKDEAKKEKLAKQAVDLALLSNGMLKGKDLAEFISRSVDMID